MVQTTQHSVTKRPSGQTLFRECKGALTRSVALACAKDSSLALYPYGTDKAVLRILKDRVATKRPFGQRIAAQRFAITHS